MNLPITQPNLDGLATFLAVAQLQGFRAAARGLGVTPSAVSQSIRQLEERIGSPLFARTTRSVRLTEGGERLLAHAQPALEMLSAGIAAARGLGDRIGGRLRISVPRPSLPLLVNRLLPAFLDLHPDVQLDLVGDDRLIDIVEEGFDAGIRLGQQVQQDMVAVWLTPPEKFVVIGAPKFFARYGRPAEPHDLRNQRCILLQQATRIYDHWQFAVNGKQASVQVQGPLIANDVETCVRAALRGVGLFRLPRSIVMHHLHQKSLETVLDEWGLEVLGLSLYFPSRSKTLPKLRAFVDFAVKNMRRDFEADDYEPALAI